MIINEQSNYKYHIKKALNKMQNVNKRQYNFMLEIFGLYLSIKGRLNFLQFSRFGKFYEQSYRNQFQHNFDFLEFNKSSILEQGSGHFTIAFDPSYISKSGKETYGVGYYWSGVAGSSKWGLEIGGIAAIDIDNHTAFHLEAVQTPSELESQSLLDFYAQSIIERKTSLQEISSYVVADAYFSKEPFTTELTENGFELVSRLRNDAYLRYEFIGNQKGGRGRPKQYDGKVDFNNLDMKHFTLIQNNNQTKIYNAKVHSKALKRYINLVIVYTKRKDKFSHQLYFSTDLNIEANLLLEYYQTRFQIEFIYRDAKQFTGLNDFQGRSKEKLDFHFNTSLTTINIAKITHWISIPKEDRKAFSMSSIKTMYHNQLLINRFINVFGISPNKNKNNKRIRELVKWGVVAA